MILLMLPLIPFATSTNNDTLPAVDQSATPLSYIVQASSAEVATTYVNLAGGEVTATLSIIDAVGALLTADQSEWLQSQPERIRVFDNGTLEISGRKPKKSSRKPVPVEDPITPVEPVISNLLPATETWYPKLVGAANLHMQGITGKGVTIAVLDTGLWKSPTTEFNAAGKQRVLAQHDVTSSGGDYGDIDDWNGHGTHITSIMVSSGRTEAGHYQGIAPNANVVVVRAFEADGSGTYLNVIKALDWIVSQRKKHKIRILNLSFGAPATSLYWNDPVNQAVMAVWKSGIIVVAAAGNNGPDSMTIGVPGNVPYIITVGAMTDNFTPQDRADDKMASFSAAGPTIEGFVKPELVAPGGHMLGQMPPYAWLLLDHPDHAREAGREFIMSGTSQATAVVSGVLALMLEEDQKLKPDEAKCRVLASARAAMRNDGTHAYSVFQQGAGLVDAVAAVNETIVDCANRNMDIKKDIEGQIHYVGPANIDANEIYYLVNDAGIRLLGPGYEWDPAAKWSGDALWQQGPVWNQSKLWATGKLWSGSKKPPKSKKKPKSKMRSQGKLWGTGKLWPDKKFEGEALPDSVSINNWVESE